MQIPIFILILVLSLNVAIAQDESETDRSVAFDVNQKIAQKMKMVDLILNSPDLLQRVEASEDSVVKELIARAAQNFLQGEEYFDRGQYLEAEAVLDYVLRDLSASSQLLGVSQQKRNRYQKFIEQLDSFALPEWINLDEQDVALLQTRLERVSELRNRAIRVADTESYDEAMVLLEQAYQIKTSLLGRFDHETLIVYDLNFETIQDEYQYLINRTYHYLDLVQVAMSNREVEQNTRVLTDKYLYGSMLNLQIAEDMGSQSQFSEAIPILDESINKLSAILKLLGIRI